MLAVGENDGKEKKVNHCCADVFCGCDDSPTALLVSMILIMNQTAGAAENAHGSIWILFAVENARIAAPRTDNSWYNDENDR